MTSDSESIMISPSAQQALFAKSLVSSRVLSRERNNMSLLEMRSDKKYAPSAAILKTPVEERTMKIVRISCNSLCPLFTIS